MKFDPESDGIELSSATPTLNSSIAQSGKRLSPEQHLLLMSADEWENFIREWAQFKKTQYYLVDRLGGSNDYGIDVAGFLTDKGFEGEWDNYQCKYYLGAPIAPGVAIPEIGKLIWHVFREEISLPRKY